jgi:hypothetical protein
MLVLEDSDEDRLYLAKGLPRAWVASGNKIGIERAPTRWGPVAFSLQSNPQAKTVKGEVELVGTKTPDQIHFKVRLPIELKLRNITVNGAVGNVAETLGDTIVIATHGRKKFELLASWE